MCQPISIVSISSVSSLGVTQEEIWKNYINGRSLIKEKQFENDRALVAQLSDEIRKKIDELRTEKKEYRTLDDTVLFAMYVTRNAIKKAHWQDRDDFGINIGSSRGATSLFEKYHQDFLLQKKISSLTSPTTTLGNISSWVAQDLQTKGPEISHSITCSTALHALLNGIAWMQANMCDRFLVGGSEAPLTPFTIAQMRALKIYARSNKEFPCRALDLTKKENTMVLGEGAAVACLEKGNTDNALAVIEGYGYASEELDHNASISENGICFQEAMKMAIGTIPLHEIDVIVTHTPGTIKGDQAECNAIKTVFKDKLPFLTNNKWIAGHTLGTSGMLSIEMAIQMFQKQKFLQIPYLKKDSKKKKISRILVNAVGFGGNAVSILLSNKR